MDLKPKTWIEHPTFGKGRVSEDRGDRLDIDFVSSGRKTLLKSTELKPAIPPSPDFKFRADKVKSSSPRFKVERPPRRPSLDFDHLVEGFARFFDGGFNSQDFNDKERKKKEKAASSIQNNLSKDRFDMLLRGRDYASVCAIAEKVLQKTKLVYRIEKIQFTDAILDNVANHERFAKVLYDLLYGSAEMELRFTRFCGLLSEMGVNKWPIATYYQFLSTDGKFMFMKPSIMKRMADSLKISLNYKSEPNWFTYSKLQELANRVDSELQNRGLKPRSGIDVQGFIWASIQIEAGKYGKRK
jgi:hypothetical protein